MDHSREARGRMEKHGRIRRGAMVVGPDEAGEAASGNHHWLEGTLSFSSAWLGENRSSAITPKPRRNSEMPSSCIKSARWPLCTCSIRPLQRPAVADHSRQKRITKVLVGGTPGGSATVLSRVCSRTERGTGDVPVPRCRCPDVDSTAPQQLEPCLAFPVPTIPPGEGSTAYLFPVRIEDVPCGNAGKKEAGELDIDKDEQPFQVTLPVGLHVDRRRAIGVSLSCERPIPAI